MAVSFFILSVFIFWGAAILTCKCMGRQRVGGLCAGRLRITADSKGKFRTPPYLWALRCTFMAFGCCMMLLCVALVGPGLSSLGATSVSTRKINRDIKDMITQGLLIMDSVKRVRWNIEKLDVESILNVEGACPNLEKNTFVTDRTFRSSVEGMSREFDQLEEYIDGNNLEGMREQIDRILDGADYIDDAVTTFEKNDWTVRMFALVLSVLAFFLTFASCTALGGKCSLPALTCMSELFILPLFVLAVMCSWFGTAALAFASITNAGE